MSSNANKAFVLYGKDSDISPLSTNLDKTTQGVQNKQKIEIRQCKCNVGIHDLYCINKQKLNRDFWLLKRDEQSMNWLSKLCLCCFLFVFLPGLHSWFNFHHFVRHMYNTDGDLSSLRVALALQEVIDPGLQETPQLRLRQSCLGGRAHSTVHFYFGLMSLQILQKRKTTYMKQKKQPWTARQPSDKKWKLHWPIKLRQRGLP